VFLQNPLFYIAKMCGGVGDVVKGGVVKWR